MFKRFCLTVAVLGLGVSLASSVPVAKFAQLIQQPNAFQPSAFYDDSEINPGFQVNKWEFGGGSFPPLTLSKLKRPKSKTSGWQLDASSEAYKISSVGTKQRVVYTFKDTVMNIAYEVRVVDFKPFKDTYLVQRRFKDGSGSFEIVDAEYSDFEGNSSGFERGGQTHMLTYHLQAFRKRRSAFCAMATVTCK